MPEKDYAPSKRTALIEDIQKCGASGLATAESAAMSAARKPGDKDAAAYARERVLVHDARQAMITEVINLVYKHWPRVAEAEPAKPPTKAS